MNKYIIAIIIAFLTASPAGSKTVRQYNEEIKSETDNLKELRKTLQDKKKEKEKIEKEEQKIRKELSEINQKLRSNQREREKLRREIIYAKKRLNKAEKDLEAAGFEKKQWMDVFSYEADSLNRTYHSHRRLFTPPANEKLRLGSLKKKSGYIEEAIKRENSSKKALNEWKYAQKRLTGLKKLKEKTAKEFAGIKSRQNKLLKTTTGRKLVAEAEIKSLDESAKALAALIKKLAKEKKKRETAQAGKKRSRIVKQLPWPVQGKVVSQFGKNKHPDLDTYVISNGIRINASSGAAVKAVDKGNVAFAGEFRSYGLMIVVDHSGKYYSIYGNLGQIAVEEEQKLLEGDTLGKLGGGKDHALYFEIRLDGSPEDPLLWLK